MDIVGTADKFALPSLTKLAVSFTHLGAEWVMWLLACLSIVSVAVMIERAVYFWLRRVDTDKLARDLEAHLRAGDMRGAMDLVKDSPASVCVVAASGLENYDGSTQVVSEAMYRAKTHERLKLESYLSVLATLGNNAPFVGLLGTVLGIIKASQDVAAAQVLRQSASSAAMAGVFEALVATAVGLFVAIPAVVAYNLFQRRVRATMGRADGIVHLLLMLHRPMRPAPPTGRTTTL
jgi:biopolymer transport protein ExbB